MIATGIPSLNAFPSWKDCWRVDRVLIIWSVISSSCCLSANWTSSSEKSSSSSRSDESCMSLFLSLLM